MLDLSLSGDFVGSDRLFSLSLVQCAEEQLYLSKMIVPNYKGALTQSSHIFAPLQIDKQPPSLYNHTASTANKIRKNVGELP